KISLTEFAINSSISTSIEYAPFELNGGYMPTILKEVRGKNSPSQEIKKFAKAVLINMAVIYNMIIEVRVFQTQQANKHRLPEPDIKVNNFIYLVTKNLNLSKGRSSKLYSKYIEPFKIVEVRPKFSNYHLKHLLVLQLDITVVTDHHR
ncbi:hypothetical protein AN958_04309, partial [Leucoagaricus sp. SymC.cos]